MAKGKGDDKIIKKKISCLNNTSTQTENNDTFIAYENSSTESEINKIK